MKKTLLATALALGFAGAAQAQTSITLYGLIDAGLGYTRFKDGNAGTAPDTATKFGLEDGVQGGNRWGMRGVEDLGDGLKMQFQLEGGFLLSRGTMGQSSRLFGREATLALASDHWGTLTAGRTTNFADRYVAGLLAQGDAWKVGHGSASFSPVAVRVDNAVLYETPKFSGFQFGVGYSFNQDGGQTYKVSGSSDPNNRLLMLGLRYTNGPLALAASYDQMNGPTFVNKLRGFILAATYDFEVLKLHLSYGQDRNGVFEDRGTAGLPARAGGVLARNSQSAFTYINGYKTNSYGVGLTVPLEAGDVRFAWQTVRLGSGAYKDTTANGEKNSQNLYTAIYTYPLSKRTNVYAVGTYGTGFAFNDVKVTQAVVGLRHRF